MKKIAHARFYSARVSDVMTMNTEIWDDVDDIFDDPPDITHADLKRYLDTNNMICLIWALHTLENTNDGLESAETMRMLAERCSDAIIDLLVPSTKDDTVFCEFLAAVLTRFGRDRVIECIDNSVTLYSNFMVCLKRGNLKLFDIWMEYERKSYMKRVIRRRYEVGSITEPVRCPENCTCLDCEWHGPNTKPRKASDCVCPNCYDLVCSNCYSLSGDGLRYIVKGNKLDVLQYIYRKYGYIFSLEIRDNYDLMIKLERKEMLTWLYKEGILSQRQLDRLGLNSSYFDN